tara:strand:+ start:1967 stop:2830 length:864 start_codon:yes stop_codon:yes gene_type:complete
MPHLSEPPPSWYADPIWLSGGASFELDGQFSMARGSIKGIGALFTPPGALHIGWNREPNWNALDQSGFPCVILDLPPGMTCEGDSSWSIQQRHTRQLHWNLEDGDPVNQLPNHRLKQIRKGDRNGLRLELTDDAERILELHQAARQRKNLNSNVSVTRAQLEKILESPHQTAGVVLDQNDRDVASAVFLHEKGRTIYAFGGQRRSKESAWASVILIAAGLRSAYQRGNTCFDFGGSMDPGVDQFYAEFGAQPVPKLRCIRIARWARPWLRLTRPDLFDSNSSSRQHP